MRKLDNSLKRHLAVYANKETCSADALAEAGAYFSAIADEFDHKSSEIKSLLNTKRASDLIEEIGSDQLELEFNESSVYVCKEDSGVDYIMDSKVMLSLVDKDPTLLPYCKTSLTLNRAEIIRAYEDGTLPSSLLMFVSKTEKPGLVITKKRIRK